MMVDCEPPQQHNQTQYYDDVALRAASEALLGLPTGSAALDRSLVDLHCVLGYDSSRRNNLHYIHTTDGNRNLLLCAVGNIVQILDFSSQPIPTQIHLHGHGAGIGAIAVHPSYRYFAACDKGQWPGVYIYEYPSLKIYKVLSRGTQRSYTAAAFSPSGARLATVGGAPDYTLTVWNWEEEKILLRTKAFGQEVYRVTFSPTDEGILTSSGAGHIKFWKIARTFTGLKMHGEIGKFGKTKLSDIAAYAALPDSAKVIAGTESGTLLLWEGNLIKCEITRKLTEPCHRGMIEVIAMETVPSGAGGASDRQYLVTAGADGVIRTWDYDTVANADGGEAALMEVEPLEELRIGDDVSIKALHRGTDHYVLLDERGAFWKCGLPGRVVDTGAALAATTFATIARAERLLTFHAGAVAAVDTCPTAHIAASVGIDGTVRLYDYIQKRQTCVFRIGTAGTCLIWAPPAVDHRGRTLLVGTADGVVRIFLRCRDGIKLIRSLKPHTAAVTAMAFAPNGRCLATAALDGTVFFFDVATASQPTALPGEEYAPMAFVRVPPAGHSPNGVTAVSWAADGSALLVCCHGGAVWEFTAPVATATGAAESYEIQLPVRSVVFVPPVSANGTKKPATNATATADEAIKPANEPSTTPTDSTTYRSGGAEMGTNASNSNASSEAASVGSATNAADTASTATLPPGKIIACFYSSKYGKESAIVSLDGADAGILREISLRLGGVADVDTTSPLTAKETKALPTRIGTPIRAIAFSKKGRFLLSGGDDGSVHLRRMDVDVDKLWVGLVHDRDAGRITSLSTSFDDAFLVTAAADGTLFVHRIHSEFVLPDMVSDSDLPLVGDVATPPGANADLTNSIEEAKRFAEHTKRLADAELKKEIMRQRVARIREEFQELRRQLIALGVPADEIAVDPDARVDRDLAAVINDEISRRLAAVRAEFAEETARCEEALARLRSRFLENIVVDRIVVRAFRGGFSVATFRVPALPPPLRAAIDDVHRLVDAEEADRRRRAELEEDHRRMFAAKEISMSTRSTDEPSPSEAHATAMNECGLADVDHVDMPTTDGDAASRTGPPKPPPIGPRSVLTRAEERRKRREQREREWAEFLESRPDDNADDPADLRQLREAERDMGDYVLKTAPDYIVPEIQRTDAEKKRRQMLLLEESVYSMKMNFNEKLLELRQLKQDIIAGLKEDNRRIREINEILGVSEELFEPVMDESEMPEERFKLVIAPADGAAQRSTEKITTGDTSRKDAKAPLKPAMPPSDVPLSDLEFAERYALHRRLESEKAVILARVDKALTTFDSYLSELRRQKVQLEGDLKAIDLKKLVLYQELILLKEFEKRGISLAKRLGAVRAEKADYAVKIELLRRQLDERSEELESRSEAIKAAEAAFRELVKALPPAVNDFIEPLEKIFSKTIHRKNKSNGKDKASGSEGVGAAASEDGEMSDEDYDSDESDDEPDVLPVVNGILCDKLLFNKVLELRERRTKAEEERRDLQKELEPLRAKLSALEKKDEKVNESLLALERELQEFQKEKQTKLNQLDVVVALRMSQIQYIGADGKPPDNLSAAVVFTNANLQKLEKRIADLNEEKRNLKLALKELKKTDTNLSRDKKLKKQKNKELEARSIEVQMLKFGQVINLESLERMSVNKPAEELKERLQKEDRIREHELSVLDDLHQQKKEKLAEVTAENTRLLQRLADLSEARQKLESALDFTQNSMVAEYTGTQENELRQREQLIMTARLQQIEIKKLQEQIKILRQKGGFVNSMVQQAMLMQQHQQMLHSKQRSPRASSAGERTSSRPTSAKKQSIFPEISSPGRKPPLSR